MTPLDETNLTNTYPSPQDVLGMEASLAVSLQRASAVAVSCLSVIYVHNYTIRDLFKEFHSSRKGLFCRYQLSIVSILLTVESCYLENHAFLVPEPAEKPPLQFH